MILAEEDWETVVEIMWKIRNLTYFSKKQKELIDRINDSFETKNG